MSTVEEATKCITELNGVVRAFEHSNIFSFWDLILTR